MDTKLDDKAVEAALEKLSVEGRQGAGAEGSGEPAEGNADDTDQAKDEGKEGEDKDGKKSDASKLDDEYRRKMEELERKSKELDERLYRLRGTIALQEYLDKNPDVAEVVVDILEKARAGKPFKPVAKEEPLLEDDQDLSPEARKIAQLERKIQMLEGTLQKSQESISKHEEEERIEAAKRTLDSMLADYQKRYGENFDVDLWVAAMQRNDYGSLSEEEFRKLGDQVAERVHNHIVELGKKVAKSLAQQKQAAPKGDNMVRGSPGVAGGENKPNVQFGPDLERVAVEYLKRNLTRG